MNQIYLYIFEDSSIKASKDAPTEAEIQSINDGYLQVIKIEGTAQFADEYGNWIDFVTN